VCPFLFEAGFKFAVNIRLPRYLHLTPAKGFKLVLHCMRNFIAWHRGDLTSVAARAVPRGSRRGQIPDMATVGTKDKTCIVRISDRTIVVQLAEVATGLDVGSQHGDMQMCWATCLRAFA
jgi:hypothetical protein